MAESWIAHLVPSDPAFPAYCVGLNDRPVRSEALAERFYRERDAESSGSYSARRLGGKFGCGYRVVAIPDPTPNAEAPRA